MTVARGLAIIVAIGAGFAAAGGLLGLALGVGAPSYYRGVFHATDDPGFRPAQVGVGLGVTQGLVCGLVIGSVVVLAAALPRRRDPESDAVGAPAHLGDPESFWLASLQRGIKIAAVLAVVACSGLFGFVVGAVVGQGSHYQHIGNARLAKVRPVLREPAFAGVRSELTSDGKVELFGRVGSELDLKALQERMRFLFGDEDARTLTGGVDIATK